MAAQPSRARTRRDFTAERLDRCSAAISSSEKPSSSNRTIASRSLRRERGQRARHSLRSCERVALVVDDELGADSSKRHQTPPEAVAMPRAVRVEQHARRTSCGTSRRRAARRDDRARAAPLRGTGRRRRRASGTGGARSCARASCTARAAPSGRFRRSFIVYKPEMLRRREKVAAISIISSARRFRCEFRSVRRASSARRRRSVRACRSAACARRRWRRTRRRPRSACARRSSRSTRVEAEVRREALGPLEVVVEAPVVVAAHVDALVARARRSARGRARRSRRGARRRRWRCRPRSRRAAGRASARRSPRARRRGRRASTRSPSAARRRSDRAAAGRRRSRSRSKHGVGVEHRDEAGCRR